MYVNIFVTFNLIRFLVSQSPIYGQESRQEINFIEEFERLI